MHILEQASLVATSRRGAQLIARVFESWDYWGGTRLEMPNCCPGCGESGADDPLTIHLEGCWFTEAREYLKQFQIEPPPLLTL